MAWTLESIMQQSIKLESSVDSGDAEDRLIFWIEIHSAEVGKITPRGFETAVDDGEFTFNLKGLAYLFFFF